MTKFSDHLNLLSLSLASGLIVSMSPAIAVAQDVGNQSTGDNIAYAGIGDVAFSEYLGSDDLDDQAFVTTQPVLEYGFLIFTAHGDSKCGPRMEFRGWLLLNSFGCLRD